MVKRSLPLPSPANIQPSPRLKSCGLSTSLMSPSALKHLRKKNNKRNVSICCEELRDCAFIAR